MTTKHLFLSSVLLMASASAIAELFVSPISKNYKEASISFGKADVDYKVNIFGVDVGDDIERTFISGSYSIPQSEKFNLFGFGQFGFDVDNGDGFIFGGGAKGPLPFSPTKDLNLHWYSQFAYLSEDYGTEDGVSIKGSGYELSLGVVSVHPIDADLTVWGGLEIIPLSDLEAKFEESDGFDTYTDTIEFERDGILGLRLGAEYGSWSFSLSLLNETTFMVGYRKSLGNANKSRPYRPANKTSTKPAKVYSSPARAAPVSIPSAVNEPPYSSGNPTLQVQQTLSSMGYDPGPTDGVMGGRTRSALKSFQQDQGLAVTGNLDSETRAALGLE